MTKICTEIYIRDNTKLADNPILMHQSIFIGTSRLTTPLDDFVFTSSFTSPKPAKTTTVSSYTPGFLHSRPILQRAKVHTYKTAFYLASSYHIPYWRCPLLIFPGPHTLEELPFCLSHTKKKHSRNCTMEQVYRKGRKTCISKLVKPWEEEKVYGELQLAFFWQDLLQMYNFGEDNSRKNCIHGSGLMCAYPCG